MVAEEKVEMEGLIEGAAKLRGHLCVGIPLGVRMGLQGLALLGMDDKESRENLMVVAETNSCSVDGIQVSTGCSAGGRKLRVYEYGRSAAVFYDGITGKGFRVSTRPEFDAQALALAVKDGIVSEGQEVEEGSKLDRKIMMNAFLRMPIEELLECRPVKITAKSLLRQGRNHVRSVCSQCGEVIMDGRGITRNDQVFCYPCFYGAYYTVA